jgi:hypothetical protein
METNEHVTEELIELWRDWVRERSVNDLLARVDLTAIGREVAKDDETHEAAYKLYDLLWDWIRDELAREERTVREVFGSELSGYLIKLVQATEPDEETARILFRSSAAEAMFGRVLYEGITEFLSQVDMIGAILDKVPLIGGIKGKIQDNIPEGTGGLVEGRIKQFLGNFSGAACEKALNFVLSPEHVDDVQAVQAEVVSHLLDQPVNGYVPEEEESERFKQALWAGLEERLNEIDLLMDRLDRFYERISSHSLDEFFPEELPPTVKKVSASVLERFLEEEPVQKWFSNQMADKWF